MAKGTRTDLKLSCADFSSSCPNLVTTSSPLHGSLPSSKSATATYPWGCLSSRCARRMLGLVVLFIAAKFEVSAEMKSINFLLPPRLLDSDYRPSGSCIRGGAANRDNPKVAEDDNDGRHKHSDPEEQDESDEDQYSEEEEDQDDDGGSKDKPLSGNKQFSSPFQMKLDVYNQASHEPSEKASNVAGSDVLARSKIDGEGGNENDPKSGHDDIVPSGLTDVAKLWWVNVWTQQLSDVRDGDEEESLATDDQDKQSPSHDHDDDDDQTVHITSDTEELSEGDEGSVGSEATIEVETEPFSEAIQVEIETDELASIELDVDDSVNENVTVPLISKDEPEESVYVSSGVWKPLDAVFSFGLSINHPSFRLSRQLRGVRKAMASASGFHGILSGKPLSATEAELLDVDTEVDEESEDLNSIRQRLAAIQRAREVVERADNVHARRVKRKGWFKGKSRDKTKSKKEDDADLDDDAEEAPEQLQIRATEAETENIFTRMAEKRRKEAAELEERLKLEEARIIEKERREDMRRDENRRMDRVREIDRLMAESQSQLQELACEKDMLQRRPNPLWNYTVIEPDGTLDKDGDDDRNDNSETSIHLKASRRFTFPPQELVDEYLEMIFSTGRITKMNHSFLWKDGDISDDDDDESIGDDLLTPSADAHKLYAPRYMEDSAKNGEPKMRHKNKGGGSWLLRRSLGKGRSLGEKIGEAAETAAYKAVCAALMSFLARLLSSLHGINVMKHADIRLVLEQTPDLPPVGPGIIPGMSPDYAQETIKTLMRQKARKPRKGRKHRVAEDSFLQRDAVVEMLLSHCQISAPLLKLFPLAWQRALLGNIITLSTAIMSDFFDGLQFQILGHQLSFTFRPITESDMMQYFGLLGNDRRVKPEQFEAAVRATAIDVGEELKFLDRWHERLLGSGVLRTQIANLIARIVLTLTDEVLSGAKIDLWSAQAGGPRMLAGIEPRVRPLESV